MATAPIRPLPDFVIIGAKRSGTTSTFRYLESHPQVLAQFPPAARVPFMALNTKGVHWFDRSPRRGRVWYRSHFPTSITRALAEHRLHGRVVCGEASPYYLVHPTAPTRAAEELGDKTRLIVVLRNPVERAYSHWAEQRRDGREPLDFAEALAAETGRLRGEEDRLARHTGATSEHHEHHSYRWQGEYARFLERWLACFPSTRVHVMISEGLYRDPQATMNGVFGFLGLPPHELATALPWNAAPRAPMPAQMRQEAEGHYRPWNERLTALTGLRPSWDG